MPVLTRMGIAISSGPSSPCIVAQTPMIVYATILLMIMVVCILSVAIARERRFKREYLSLWQDESIVLIPANHIPTKGVRS